MTAWLEAARSWVRWHLPVTFGTAARLVDAERALIDRRINALFRAMADASDAAGLHEEAEQCRIAAGTVRRPPSLHSVSPD